jgi:hypothetical protein
MPDNKPFPGDLPDLPAGYSDRRTFAQATRRRDSVRRPSKDGLPPLPGGAVPSGRTSRASERRIAANARRQHSFQGNAEDECRLPYIKRALKLLKGHMGFVAVSFVLSLIMCLLPFVAAAAMGPIFKLFGQAAQGGDWSKVWSMTSSFYDTSTDGAGPGWFPPAFIRNWLSTPLTFTTIFIIWTVSLVFRNVIDILRAWIEANLEQRILSSLRQHVYDHIQSLSLDFFMGGQTGALMQRVLSETGTVQRLLTQVLLTPVVDVLVMIIVDRLPAGAELANDSGAFCARAVDVADVPIHQRQAATGRDGNQHEFARTRGRTGRNDQRHFGHTGFQRAKETQRPFSRSFKVRGEKHSLDYCLDESQQQRRPGLYLADHRHGDAGRNSFGPEVGSDFFIGDRFHADGPEPVHPGAKAGRLLHDVSIARARHCLNLRVDRHEAQRG